MKDARRCMADSSSTLETKNSKTGLSFLVLKKLERIRGKDFSFSYFFFFLRYKINPKINFFLEGGEGEKC